MASCSSWPHAWWLSWQHVAAMASLPASGWEEFEKYKTAIKA